MLGRKRRGTEISVSKIPREFAIMTEDDLAEAATAVLLQPVHSSSLPKKQCQPHRAHLGPHLGAPDGAA